VIFVQLTGVMDGQTYERKDKINVAYSVQHTQLTGRALSSWRYI